MLSPSSSTKRNASSTTLTLKTQQRRSTTTTTMNSKTKFSNNVANNKVDLLPSGLTPKLHDMMLKANASSVTNKLRSSKVIATSEFEKLEEENRKMEERLQALRKTMEQEKQKRLTQGYSWKAGRSGSGVTNYAKEVLERKNKKPVASRSTKGFSGVGMEADKTRKMVEENKMSVADVSARPRPTFQKAPVVEEMNEMPLWRVPTALGRTEDEAFDGPQKILINPSKAKPSNHKVHAMGTDTSVDDDIVPSKCGSHLLNGAYDEKASRNSFLEALNEWRNGGKNQTEGEKQEVASTSKLLEGEFNEQDSHASFLDALKEWRSGKQEVPKRGLSPAYNLEGNTVAMSTSTENDSLLPRKPQTEIKFSETNGMSYADKLLLYKLRKEMENNLNIQ